ncbi:MAG TPA: hypothetical protein VKD72_13885 [Gemmataceae bacterium]|nr:hypothetical protein [Gemmataceae bacterium]
MKKKFFALSDNYGKRTPNWVSWRKRASVRPTNVASFSDLGVSPGHWARRRRLAGTCRAGVVRTA